MENNELHDIWDDMVVSVPPLQPQDLITKAMAQRRNQKAGIVVMLITVGILICYAVWQFPKEINMFITGLFLMVSFLLARIGIEYFTRLRNVSRLLELDVKNYLSYLKRYYYWRKRIHFIVTPICFGGYIFGLTQLFPYFKNVFSQGFYIYLIVSAIVSLSGVAIIIIRQAIKELQFIKKLQ